MNNILYRLKKTQLYLFIKGILLNYKECFLGFWHYIYLQIYRLSTDKPQVLIVEINAFHGETLPGIVDYFQQLGYHVTVITRYFVWHSFPFDRMTQKPRQFCLTIWGMRHYLKSKHALKYDFIFYNSSSVFLNEYNFYGKINSFLRMKELPAGKHGNALFEHDLKENDELICKNTFLLTPWIHHGKMMPMCNPHRFGEIKNSGHKLNSKRIFITVGNIISTQRDFNLLNTLLSLCGSYELRIVGVVKEQSVIEHFPQNCLKILGRLSFPELYEQIQEADFFLPLLDPQKQAKYLYSCTSGSRQLILGFGIPAIIHKAFAEHYGFSEDSCLSYADEISFSSALTHALNMKNDEYNKMKIALKNISGRVYNESLDNLKNSIN